MAVAFDHTPRLRSKTPAPYRLLHTVTAAEPTPRGLPRVGSSPDDDSGGENCWSAASVSLLANDRVIAAFVLDVWDNDRRNVRRVYQGGAERFQAEDKERHELAMCLLRCIWLTNNQAAAAAAGVRKWAGSLSLRASKSEWTESLREATRALYLVKQSQLQAGDRGDTMGDAITEGFLVDLSAIQHAMIYWWQPHLGENGFVAAFQLYGSTAMTSSVTTCAACGVSKTTPPPSPSELLQPLELVSFKIEAPKDAGVPLDLQQEIVLGALNTPTQLDTEGGIDYIEHLEACRAQSKPFDLIRMSCLVTLPWRFCVQVNRRPGYRGAVCYDPRSLLLGPTMNQAEWGHYRLVGRLWHRSQHWTSVVLPLGTVGANESYDDSQAEVATGKAWPQSLYEYSWDQVSPFKQPGKKDFSGRTWSDTTSHFLVFERHE